MRGEHAAADPGNDKSLASTTTAVGREDRSVSMLEDSMILLSEGGAGGGDGACDDEKEACFSVGEEGFDGKENSPHMKQRQTAPIERTRHSQYDPPCGTSLALDNDNVVGPPPFFSTRKRPASNSGK